MNANNVVDLKVERRETRPGGCSASLLTLMAIDVMAFIAAVWLMVGVPEAFDVAANSANAGASFARPDAPIIERFPLNTRPNIDVPVF